MSKMLLDGIRDRAATWVPGKRFSLADQAGHDRRALLTLTDRLQLELSAAHARVTELEKVLTDFGISQDEDAP